MGYFSSFALSLLSGGSRAASATPDISGKYHQPGTFIALIIEARIVNAENVECPFGII